MSTLHPSKDLKRFDFSKYVTLERFISYWYQLSETTDINPDHILEVGIGPGVVKQILKLLGYNVVSIDIDGKLLPDTVADLRFLPFASKSFDLIICCQVLEHLPFAELERALYEFRRVARKYVLISLPDVQRYYRVMVTLPLIGTRRVGFEVPRLRKLPHVYDGKHWWEMGKEFYSGEFIVHKFKEAGFSVSKDYRLFNFPYHHFFLLEISS